MKVYELDYDLPPELIAQYPLADRDQARLLVIKRRSTMRAHSRFYKLADHLREGDLVVLNDTRVLPARLYASKESGGRAELLFIRPVADPKGGWLAMARAPRGLGVGSRLMLADERALNVAAISKDNRLIIVSEDGAPLEDVLNTAGTLALPHYIRREVGPADADDYQTVYARTPGAIAAPTAGLHFTERVFADLATAGIRVARITLHIGPGTFAPVREALVEGHSMEAEWFTIDAAAREAIEHTKRMGGRVVAVGTSSVRALESWAITGETEGPTGLFIYPGFRFKLVDAMITNFHMPRTTVLALVMALAGRETILQAYDEAIRHKYRFLSYGDAMLIF